MKVITKNSVYVVDGNAKTVTGGIFGDMKVNFARIANVHRGEEMFFLNANGGLVLKTSPVRDIVASLFDDAALMQN